MPARPFQFRLRHGLLAVAILAVLFGFLKSSVMYTFFAFMAMITMALAAVAAWSLTQECLRRLRERTSQSSRPVSFVALILSFDMLSIAVSWVVVVASGLVMIVLVFRGFLFANQL